LAGGLTGLTGATPPVPRRRSRGGSSTTGLLIGHYRNELPAGRTSLSVALDNYGKYARFDSATAAGSMRLLRVDTIEQNGWAANPRRGRAESAIRPKEPHSSVRLLYPFAEALRDEGIDLDSVLAAAAIQRPTYDNPDSRIPFTAARRFHFAAASNSRNPALGLAAARHFALAQFQILEYLVASNTHLGPALDRLVENERVLSDYNAISLEPRAEGILVRVDSMSDGAHRCWFEFAVGAIYLAGQRIRGALPARGERAVPWFAYAAPAGVAEYQAFFNRPVRFDAPANGLLVSPTVLHERLETADTRLRQALDVHLQGLVPQPPATRSLLERARSLVGDSLADGDPSMAAIASSLHMSRSTLRRRLRQLGTTHRALLQEVRRDRALRYLEQQELSIEEIAYLVGYDDSTAFHKAFRKWTGATPAELRGRMGRRG
jgi:AraC-like DNA-binding protein